MYVFFTLQLSASDKRHFASYVKRASHVVCVMPFRLDVCSHFLSKQMSTGKKPKVAITESNKNRFAIIPNAKAE